ncbi:MAG TPA: polyketide synthase regulator [Clostridia bacterium]|nr:polyketide synthase regulator [Clostridia bacterium]
MINNDLIKRLSHDIQKNIQMPLYIIDKSGNLIYGNEDFFAKKAGFLDIKVEYMYEREICELENYTIYNIFIDNIPYFTIILEGVGEEARRIAGLIAIIFDQIFQVYSKEEFLLKMLYGEFDENSIYYYAEKYKIDKSVRYAVVIVETKNEIDDALKIINNIFNRTNLYTVKLNDKKFVVIFSSHKEKDSLIDFSKTMKDMIESEGYTKVKIASSSSLVPLHEIHKAYKEAETALLLGQKLEGEKGIYLYDDYIFAEILWGIDVEKVNQFIKKLDIDFSLFKEEELIQTLNAFFRNSLNLSETARELYVHRNTLVYRLDKIFKMTGLDAKKFDDALLLKTMMVLAKLYDVLG